MVSLKTSKALQYIKESTLSREEISTFKRTTIHGTTPYKKYPDSDKYPLPTDWPLHETRFKPLLQKRRSRRKFNDKTISLNNLAFLLWASQGVTASAGKYLFRTAPSAGALYPIETYISVESVDGLEQGLYHFDPELFELEHLVHESVANELSMAALNQQFIHQAAVTFVWTAVFRRNMSKYGERGLRYIMMDVGHICQNLLLAAEANNFGACPVAAFFDDEVNEILGVNENEEAAVYMAAVGTKE